MSRLLALPDGSKALVESLDGVLGLVEEYMGDDIVDILNCYVEDLQTEIEDKADEISDLNYELDEVGWFSYSLHAIKTNLQFLVDRLENKKMEQGEILKEVKKILKY